MNHIVEIRKTRNSKVQKKMTDNTERVNQIFVNISNIFKALHKHSPQQNMQLRIDKYGDHMLVSTDNMYDGKPYNNMVSKLTKSETNGVLKVTFGDTTIKSTDTTDEITAKALTETHRFTAASGHSTHEIKEALKKEKEIQPATSAQFNIAVTALEKLQQKRPNEFTVNHVAAGSVSIDNAQGMTLLAILDSKSKCEVVKNLPTQDSIGAVITDKKLKPKILIPANETFSWESTIVSEMALLFSGRLTTVKVNEATYAIETAAREYDEANPT